MSAAEWAALGFIFYGPLYFIALIVAQHVLGFLLARRYDRHFFKPPYFTPGEVAVYSAWPLSLLRYGTYIMHTGFPRILHRRRFKGHASPYTPGRFMKLSCQAWLIALVLGIVAAPMLFILMFVLLPD